MRLNSCTYKGMQRYNNEYAEINIDIKRVPWNNVSIFLQKAGLGSFYLLREDIWIF